MAIETLDALERYSDAVTEEAVKVITENVTRQKTVSGLCSQGKCPET
jgi:hypothetical protein